MRKGGYFLSLLYYICSHKCTKLYFFNQKGNIMTKIKGNNVLITGGASGIGRLMGRMSLEKGARTLIIWDINEAGTVVQLSWAQLHLSQW
jgi:NADPH:quinone reductase-like Zn-dependent oxidoreductase